MKLSESSKMRLSIAVDYDVNKQRLLYLEFDSALSGSSEVTKEHKASNLRIKVSMDD